MNDEERARRIAKLEELIRQKQEIAKRLDQPQPTLKPKGETTRREPFVEKTPEDIKQEAIAIDGRREAEAQKAKDAAIEKLSPFERADNTELSNGFAEAARDRRPTMEERRERLQAFVDRKEKEAKIEKAQERDSRFGSRFLRDDEREL